MKTFADLKTTKEEFILIGKIIDRLEIYFGGKIGRISLLMDIEAAHGAIPLNLQQLLDFPDGDFAHDLCGITANLNRKTLELENCFTPRCSA